MEREAVRKFLESDSPNARMLKEAVRKGLVQTAAEMPDPEPGEKAAIIIGPTTDIIGSKQVTCTCGKKGWISPSTQELMAERGPDNFEFMCAACLPTRMAQLDREREEGVQ
jgi:hypothetical protein